MHTCKKLISTAPHSGLNGLKDDHRNVSVRELAQIIYEKICHLLVQPQKRLIFRPMALSRSTKLLVRAESYP